MLLLVGPGAGGLLVGVLGPASAVILVTAARSLLAALVTLVLDHRAGVVGPPVKGVVGGAVSKALADLLASWRFLARNLLVLGTTLLSAVLVAVVASLQTTVLPAYFAAAGVPALTGLTRSALAGGGIAGSALYAALAGRVPCRTWFVVGMVGFGAGFALVGSLATPQLVLGAAVLVGLTNALVAALLGVLTIEATPDEMRGRVLGAQNTLVLAAPALTAAPLGAVASAAGLGVAGTVLAGLAAVVALLVPAFRSSTTWPRSASPARPTAPPVGSPIVDHAATARCAMGAMTWSTRELAELAGTSLRAVRHYHEVGLLPVPERHSNGYKQYGVGHLVRLLRIKRLVDLGFSLSRIAAMGDDDHHPGEALRALDAELGATIERLQRARMELGLILRHHAPADLPADIAPAAGAAGLSEADRSMVLVMSRVMGPEQVGAYAEMLHSVPTDPTDGEFDSLPGDADEATRQSLAERMVPYIRRIREEYPAVMALDVDAPRGVRFVAETAAAALQELYNPAQRDVILRVGALLADS
jgi:DNA-binding transcriptional MerR regulator